MSLFSERNNMRSPLVKNSVMTVAAYAALYDCCEKHFKYLTNMFPLKSHHDFTNSDYVEFNNAQFVNRIKMKIPSLFCDEYERFSRPSKDDIYDQYALLDLIEFIGLNMKDISEGWNNYQYKNYWYIECLESSDVFSSFRNEINEIFSDAGLLFALSEEKYIERIIEHDVVSVEASKISLEAVDKGTRQLLEDAIVLFRRPHPQDQRKAVEKIWDALESLKTHFPGIEDKHFDDKLSKVLANGQNGIEGIFKKELSELGNIGNNYNIRHFNDKQFETTDQRHYDFFFNRCMSLIAIAIKYLD